MVSKLEPKVSKLTLPSAGAVQTYQIERPPWMPAWLGSPDSLVPLTFEPVTWPLAPVSSWAPANASFAGGVLGCCCTHSRVTLPLDGCPADQPSTATW